MAVTLMTTLNTTSAATSSTNSQNFFNKTFYDKKLLEKAKTQFVYANFGQKRPIPRGAGKVVEFRRFNLFTPSTSGNKLTEGVTPTAQALEQSKVEAKVEQYGAFVEMSDLLQLTAFDPLVSESVELLGEQMGTLLDWITRDAMIRSSNNGGTAILPAQQYAGGRASVAAITAADKLTVAEIRKAVRTLKMNKARKFSEGGRKPHFICICDPFATYDLQSDQLWQDVSKYSNAEQIYSGEIGRMFGVVFVESTEGKIDDHTASGAPNSSVDIHHTLIFGADAYGIVDIESSGAVKTIIKPAGSAGTADPLDQRSTVGAKIMAYTATILNNGWIIDLQHAVTA